MARRGSSNYWIENYGKPCEAQAHNWVDLEWFPGVVTRVLRGTEPIWQALGAVFLAFGYKVPTSYTGSYSCRQITGGGSWSGHSWPVAADINAKTNPYIRTPSRRTIRWGVDTDMPAAMVLEAEAILASGVQALEWGGRWRSIKDAMHYQLRVSLGEIAGGVTAPRGFYTGGGSAPGDDEMSLLGYDIGKMGDPSVKGIKSGALQKMLVDRGYDLGEFGPNNDGIDESAGETTRQALHDWKVAVGINAQTSGGEGAIGVYEYGELHPESGFGATVPDHGHDATADIKVGGTT